MAALLAALVLALAAHQEPSAVETPAPVEAVPGQEVLGRLSGVVTHAVSKLKLADAAVVLRAGQGDERHTTTNEAGFYAFKHLPADYYMVEVSLGRASVAKIFQLEPDGSMRANFNIDPAHEFSRVVRVRSRNIPRKLSPREQRRKARDEARDRRVHGKFYDVLMRAERQKERKAEAKARRRARRES